jgi:nucleotide-binding universal stress UspA family protein
MKILVGVDKTEESQMALRYACHLMEHFTAIVDALYVKPDAVEAMSAGGGYAPFATMDDMARGFEAEAEKTVEEIIEACEICVGGRIPCNPLVAMGDPADEILYTANRGYYEMIILGSPSRSRLRGLLMETVHAKILHQAQQPVLILRHYRPIRKILVAYRGSRCDQGALKFIAPLFSRKKPEITILHVQEPQGQESDDFAQACLRSGDKTLREHGFTPVQKMTRGDFVEEVLKAVAVERYDLVVLGTYGHNPPKYLKAISDEALDLVRLTTRPVLVYLDEN